MTPEVRDSAARVPRPRMRVTRRVGARPDRSVTVPVLCAEGRPAGFVRRERTQQCFTAEVRAAAGGGVPGQCYTPGVRSGSRRRSSVRRRQASAWQRTTANGCFTIGVFADASWASRGLDAVAARRVRAGNALDRDAAIRRRCRGAGRADLRRNVPKRRRARAARGRARAGARIAGGRPAGPRTRASSGPDWRRRFDGQASRTHDGFIFQTLTARGEESSSPSTASRARPTRWRCCTPTAAATPPSARGPDASRRLARSARCGTRQSCAEEPATQESLSRRLPTRPQRSRVAPCKHVDYNGLQGGTGHMHGLSLGPVEFSPSYNAKPAGAGGESVVPPKRVTAPRAARKGAGSPRRGRG